MPPSDSKSPALAVAVAAEGVSVTVQAVSAADRLGKDAAGRLYDRIAHLLSAPRAELRPARPPVGVKQPWGGPAVD